MFIFIFVFFLFLEYLYFHFAKMTVVTSRSASLILKAHQRIKALNLVGIAYNLLIHFKSEQCFLLTSSSATSMGLRSNSDIWKNNLWSKSTLDR